MSVPDPIAVGGGIAKPHVCPLNPGQRVLLTIAGGAFLCLAGLSATAATLGNAEMTELSLQLITALGGALFGSYLLLATQSQLILEDIGIELQSAIGRRGLRHAEIAGRLEYEAKGQPVSLLVPKEPGVKAILITGDYQTDAPFDRWLARLPDLNTSDPRLAAEADRPKLTLFTLLPSITAGGLAAVIAFLAWFDPGPVVTPRINGLIAAYYNNTTSDRGWVLGAALAVVGAAMTLYPFHGEIPSRWLWYPIWIVRAAGLAICLVGIESLWEGTTPQYPHIVMASDQIHCYRGEAHWRDIADIRYEHRSAGRISHTYMVLVLKPEARDDDIECALDGQNMDARREIVPERTIYWQARTAWERGRR